MQSIYTFFIGILLNYLETKKYHYNIIMSISKKNCTQKKRSPISSTETSIWDAPDALKNEIAFRRGNYNNKFVSINKIQDIQNSIDKHQNIIDNEQLIINNRLIVLNNAIQEIRENSVNPPQKIWEQYPEDVDAELEEASKNGKSQPVQIPKKTVNIRYNAGKTKKRKNKKGGKTKRGGKTSK